MSDTIESIDEAMRACIVRLSTLEVQRRKAVDAMTDERAKYEMLIGRKARLLYEANRDTMNAALRGGTK